MKRGVLVMALLAAAGAVSAQQATIPGPQLLSGQADAKLQQAAKDAKAGNKKIVITAPKYWHDLIIEQLRKGGGGDLKVEMHDSFTESVMLRADASAAEPAAAPAPATPAPAPAPTPAAKPAPAAPPPAAKPAPTPKPAAAPATPAPKAATPPPAPKPAAAPTPAPAPATPPPSPAPEPAAAPTPEPTPPPATPAPPSPPPAAAPTPAPAPAPSAAPAPAPAPPQASASSSAAEVDAIRTRLQQSLVAGEPASGTLGPNQLEKGDMVFAQGPVKAVVRRGAVRNQLYWLEGDVNLARVEFKDLGADRFEVQETLRVGTPVLRAANDAPVDFDAVDPATAADERKVMEGRYAAGKTIKDTVKPGQLKQRDVLYVGNKVAVVVRVAGLDIERYFLVGKINLSKSSLSKEGANKYRVLSDQKD